MAWKRVHSINREDEANWRHIKAPLGQERSGRERYAAAMYFYARNQMDAEVLEIYRICAKLDQEDPVAIMKARNIGSDWITLLNADS